MKKLMTRLSAVILAVVLSVSFMPLLGTVSSGAAGEIETHAAETESVFVEPEGVSVESSSSLDNDELFEDYIEVRLNLSSAPKALNSRGARLTGTNRAVYDLLKGEIANVAAGKQSSSVFTIPVDTFVLGQDAWTAGDLGVDAIVADGAITDAAKNALMKKLDFDLNKVVSALLYDCPYELYWYDKVSGSSATGPGITATNDGTEWKILFSSGITISFSVAQGYAAGQYAVDTVNAERVSNAVSNANAIVEKYVSASDYEKLSGYKNDICDLVAYDQGAADDDTTPYGDPWQIISVFDGDDATDVVCEGYSKSFQYLCDLTSFKNDIGCITVTGAMAGGTGEGLHMWNIVNMDDSKNYLVDVTNCDEGTIGADDLLFLVPASSGNLKDGYYIELPGDTIFYMYDSNLWNLFSADEIVLSFTPYTVPERISIEQADVSDIVDKAYTGKAITQNPTVKLDNTTLTKGTDYEVSYSENTNIGMATVTIAGTGNYSGTITNNFRILFTDVLSDHQFFDSIYWAVDNNITTGWADGTFRPWNTCNRAAVVTFLWRMAGSPEPSNIAGFKDMPADTVANQDFRKAISWAVEEGITTGWDDNTFRPWQTCNRAAIMTFIWRYAGKPTVTNPSGFKDPTGNPDFDAAIAWASRQRIAFGYSDGTFGPWKDCNRASVAAFLYRYANE